MEKQSTKAYSESGGEELRRWRATPYDVVVDVGCFTANDLQLLMREPELEFLSHVICEAGGLTEAHLAFVGRLPGLQELTLRWSSVNDENLEVLNDLTGLQGLDISHTAVGTEGLRRLRNLRTLFELNLSATYVDAAGLAELRRAPSLQVLDLSLLRGLGGGLHHLRHLPRLRELNLQGTDVTTEDLFHLKELGLLEMLNIAGVEMDDLGTKYVLSLPQLRQLTLCEKTSALAKQIGPLDRWRSEPLELSVYPLDPLILGEAVRQRFQAINRLERVKNASQSAATLEPNPLLEPREVIILRFIAGEEQRGVDAPGQKQIARLIDTGDDMAGIICRKLERWLKLVHRPYGLRKGYRLTAQGRSYLKNLAET